MMKKKAALLALAAAAACALALPALAAAPDAPAEIKAPALPASVLYQGTVEQVVREDGEIVRLRMTSDSCGDYVMNISDRTFWVDSARRAAFDPDEIEAGDSLSVYHSPMATFSLPPQSAAYAVVRRMERGSAVYHEVEAVALEDGRLTITSNHGGLCLYADESTKLYRYSGGEAALADIRPGDKVMAWYEAVMSSEPAQAHAARLMLLDDAAAPAEGAFSLRGLADAFCEQVVRPAAEFVGSLF